jgi:hypothetical protein
MRAEDIARNNQFREGWQLVDFCEVGLQVFRLTLEAVTMALRQMPTIQEFVLRCLALGETDEGDIARMLGLRRDVVVGAMNVLVSDGFAVRTPSAGDQAAFRMTEAGELKLAKEREEFPQEQMLVIDYDGTRRHPIRLTSESVVRAFELRNSGALEIRPYPADPPGVEELELLEVAKVVRRQASADFRRTVLALKRIVRRNNLFREAVALVYASDQTDEIQVAFAIDGKLSEAHERAFALNAGPRKMGFVKSIGAVDTRRKLEKLVGRPMIKRLPAVAEYKPIRKEEADAFAAVAALQSIAESKVGPTRHADPAVVAYQAAVERLQIARYSLNTLAVRSLSCFEIEDLLDEALGNARSQLLVTTAGLQSAVLNGYRLRAIDKLLESKVQVEIDTFLKPQTEPRGNVYDPLAELSRRAERGRMKLWQRQHSEFFFLIQDNDLAVVSNRPFFGETSRRNGFMRIDGLVTRRSDFVEEIRTLALAGREVARRAN